MTKHYIIIIGTILAIMGYHLVGRAFETNNDPKAQYHWESRCTTIYWKYRGDTKVVCRHRVSMLSKEMYENGEKFDVVFGWRENYDKKIQRHVWIEYRNRKFDPTYTGNLVFKEDARWRINQLNPWQENQWKRWVEKTLKELK